MTETVVKTVQIIDPRIEPQPDPVYDYVIGPTQNQYYKIPASGLSNANITFNNLTTLGVDRAYLDTFEIELTAEIQFHLSALAAAGPSYITEVPVDNAVFCPAPDEWVFDSFPFNKCCEEARVNINGGAFFSQPLSYLRAKEHYMNQRSLARCYENVCPHVRPLKQNELGKAAFFTTTNNTTAAETYRGMGADTSQAFCPTRLGFGYTGYQTSPQNLEGGFNNSIVRRGKSIGAGGASIVGYASAGASEPSLAGGYENMFRTRHYMVYRVTWREPVFCSPFASRYDATYGRPLYNVTSMDLSFSLQNLGNMIRVANLYGSTTNDLIVDGYNINITSAALCYQVMTVPAERIEKPLTTIVPYRRFVPYVTDYNGGGAAGPQSSVISKLGADGLIFKSGVYTLNEIPTAIWMFIGPTKDVLQMNYEDGADDPGGSAIANNVTSTKRGHMWVTNKQFGFIKKVSLSLANTTQILNTASVQDLYRIAKANGCEDSFADWGAYDIVSPKSNARTLEATDNNPINQIMSMGCGSVLRLIPGVDIIIPDQPLIPGANANNMVFQAEIEAYVPPHSLQNSKYALWLLFEYVGVAAISPGQCEITMNPLGSGEILAVAPVISYEDYGDGEPIEGGSVLGGFSFRNLFRRGREIARNVGNFLRNHREGVSQAFNAARNFIPQGERYLNMAESGLNTVLDRTDPNREAVPAGESGQGAIRSRASKRQRCGGMVIGRGMEQWI